MLVIISIILAGIYLAITPAKAMENSITAPREAIIDTLGIIIGAIPLLCFSGIGIVLNLLLLVFIIILGILASIPLIIIFIILVILSVIFAGIIAIPILIPLLLALAFGLFGLFVICPILFLGALVLTAFILIGLVVIGIILLGIGLVLGGVGILGGVVFIIIIFGSLFVLTCPPIVCLSGVIILQMLKEKAEQEVRQCINIAFCGLLDRCPQ
jgi:hypothetical protein